MPDLLTAQGTQSPSLLSQRLMNLPPRELIKEFLSVEPRMTASQLARLDSLSRSGNPLKPFSPKEGHVYPGSYPRTVQILRRMEGDKELHADREHNNQPKVWMLPHTKYPNNYFIRQHELDCAEVFVSFFPYLSYWQSPYGDYRKAGYKDFIKHRIEPDRLMGINGMEIAWEVDRGTEDVDEQLEPKIDKYIAYSNANPTHRFTVVITLQKYRRMSLPNRAGRVLAMLQEKKRRNQFLVANHQTVIASPLGSSYVSPLDPEKLVKLY